MPRPTEEIREHHAMLERKLEGFWKMVEGLETVGAKEKGQLEGLIHFLHGELIPHAEAEEKYLYGKVREVTKNPQFTKTMEIDHEVIKDYIRGLEGEIDNLDRDSSPKQLQRIQKATSRLEGLLSPHFLKEERVYLPMLDEKLSREEVERDVIAPMHSYSGGHGPAHGHEPKEPHGHGHAHGHAHEKDPGHSHKPHGHKHPH